MRCKHFERRQLAVKPRNPQHEFFEKVFLAVVPAAMRAQNWKYSEVRVTSEDQRIWMARQWAARAVIAHFGLEPIDQPAEPAKAGA